jgi:predicted metal-binding membrane protein
VIDAHPRQEPTPAEAILPRRGQIRLGAALVGASVLGWLVLAWLVLDMSHPLAQLTMPTSTRWGWASTAAIVFMWALMMAAMMLPWALPMVLVFNRLSMQRGDAGRARSFVAAYILVWSAFSLAATAAQWTLQLAGWINPMLVSTSPVLTAALLLVAGLYQFSGLKRMCLSRCRKPLAFLLGEWRAGSWGAFTMGLRHGAMCLGCCWALMALLFVGGVMNLAWVALLSLLVAFEKLAPRGDVIAALLGCALLVAGMLRLLGLMI